MAVNIAETAFHSGARIVPANVIIGLADFHIFFRLGKI
jgi:hypothetical protein